jgi:hypothetical protein
MTPEELLNHASRFDFEIERTDGPYTFKDEISIKLISVEDYVKRWIVSHRSDCWNKKIKKFVHEPSYSNQSDKFKDDTRFSFSEALEIVDNICKYGINVDQATISRRIKEIGDEK